MLTDTRIIARQSAAAGGLEVLAQRHEVMWRDGTSAQLHPVQKHELPMLTLRALATPEGHLQLFDLAHLVRALDCELRTTPTRDVPGLVFYTLRSAFTDAASFRAAVLRHSMGTWWRMDVAGNAGHVWGPPARALGPDTTAAMLEPPLPAAGAWLQHERRAA